MANSDVANGFPDKTKVSAALRNKQFLTFSLLKQKPFPYNADELGVDAQELVLERPNLMGVGELQCAAAAPSETSPNRELSVDYDFSHVCSPACAGMSLCDAQRIFQHARHSATQEAIVPSPLCIPILLGWKRLRILPAVSPVAIVSRQAVVPLIVYIPPCEQMLIVNEEQLNVCLSSSASAVCRAAHFSFDGRIDENIVFRPNEMKFMHAKGLKDVSAGAELWPVPVIVPRVVGASSSDDYLSERLRELRENFTYKDTISLREYCAAAALDTGAYLGVAVRCTCHTSDAVFCDEKCDCKPVGDVDESKSTKPAKSSRRKRKHGQIHDELSPEQRRARLQPELYGRIFEKIHAEMNECNYLCACYGTCGRVWCRNIFMPGVQIEWIDSEVGFGVRTLVDIPHGSFVGKYVGIIERVDNSSPSQSDEYAMGLDMLDVNQNDENNATASNNIVGKERFVITSRHVGNFTRFLNHSCGGSLFVQNFFQGVYDHRLHVPAFFASRNIYAGEELTYDYQKNNDTPEDSGIAFICKCKAPKCRSRTLQSASEVKK